MEKKATDVINEIQQGKYQNVYFLQGEERYFLDQIAELLLNEVIPEQERSFNQQVIYGQDVKLGQVIASARRFPMMAERQLIVVKEAHKISDWRNEAAQNLMIGYLEQPLSSTVLAFLHPEKKLNLRTKVGKKMKEKAIFVHSKRLYSNQIVPWIIQHAKTMGLSIHPRAAGLLASNVGEDLGRIAREMNKLKLNISEGSEITDDQVHRLVGVSKNFNVFELQTAIGNRDLEKAERIAMHFERNPKNHPLVVTVSNLFGYFSKILIAAQNPRASPQALAGLLRVNPYFAREYVEAARKYSLAKIVNNLQLIGKLDLQSKGVGLQNVSQHHVLRTLIYQLIID